ncbi:chemotaxis protein CheA [Sphingomonas montanisoli]|uniref:Chemotaxis protein CheA n=1 Tax=Sphingomonas montanisoli TaxID=2606412 RepID=A0A5D9CHU7_9SPHN|nr:chemotaxis protein CheA [Sphingomonas montanisoli]TZG29615.1 chemotaxis protein CheA [Sphingomonas montanisoli]
MDDLLSDFIAETRETLEAIAGEIVAWEAAPGDRSRLDSIFRFVHTVKGSCGFLDLPRLERLSHAAEDVLADVRDDRRKPDARLVTAVLAIIDRISELTEAIDSGHALPDGDDHILIAALSEAEVSVAEESPATAIAVPANRGVARSIRLPVDLLDRMMAGVSDMVLARNELSRKLREVGIQSGIEVAFERLSLCIAEMRDSITRTRMARIEHLFTALPRLVRDISSELGKQVTLRIDGGDVELDREMIEMIRDPLTHIVRNAIDHGIERPEDRLLAGKPAIGTLDVCARQVGNHILIEILDDGRGIDADRLVRKAIDNDVITEEAASRLGWDAKLQLIFSPGLSTAQSVTAISGRGVGMDVVRANVEKIGGTVEVESVPGRGVHLTMRVPMTLTIIPALTVSCGGQHFAIPRSAIDEIVRVGGDAVRPAKLGGADVVFIRGVRLPVVALANVIGADDGGDHLHMVVLKLSGGNRYALAVDAVHDHEELVVKPAAPIIMACGIYGGTTLPDNSRPMLLLDIAAIAERAGVDWKTGGRDLADDNVEALVEPHDPILLFRDLDGTERAIPLALVERIEDCFAGAISERAGRVRLVHEGRMIPLLSCGVPITAPKVRVLRMNDGTAEIAYAIDTVIDIAPVEVALHRAATPGLVAGVMLVEDRPVEMLDSFWMFAEVAQAETPVECKPLCLLADDDAWTRKVLAPLVEAAGYRVAFDDSGAAPDLVIAGDAATGELSAPTLRLRMTSEPVDASDPSLWRYDRPALLAELQRHRTRRNAA